MRDQIYEEDFRGGKLIIRSFRNEDAAAVAAMWNESEEGWAQVSHIPHTAQSVLRDAEITDLLQYFVLTVNDRIAGICTLGRHEMKRCAYLNLINVHPDYYRDGFGRRLLVHAVNYVTETGFERLDLHTWAGNSRAVPPYKRTGFYWVPGTGT